MTTTLDDVGHWFGGDLQVSPTGDLSRTQSVTRSNQRVLRRLCTNPGEYRAHPGYGAGVPADVGSTLDLAKVRAKVRGQMLLEASVAPDPAPVIRAQAIPKGVIVDTKYIALPDRQPAALSFDASN